MKKPNFIIAGAPKCGTTALCDYLREHPRIYIPKLKEPHFFTEDMPGHQSVKTESEYLKLFRTANENHLGIGEGSVMSLYSEVALQNIKAFNPEMKIIAMLRNPIDLVYSIYYEYKYTLNEDAETFEEALKLQETRKKGQNLPPLVKDPKLLQYLEISMLGKQIEKLISLFSRDKVLILFQEDFQKNTRDVYLHVLKFLNIPDDGRVDFPRINLNAQNRSKLFATILHYSYTAQAFIRKLFDIPLLDNSKFIRKYNPITNLRKLNTKVQKRPEMNPETRQELILEFREDIQKLSKVLVVNLDHWLT